MNTPPTLPIIDCHLHMVGNGSNGSGCWIRVAGRFRPQAAALLFALGLPQSSIRGPLEELYIERILGFLQTSEVRAAVLLAHELTRDESGNPVEGFGSLYVPNDVVLNIGKTNPQLLPGVSIHPARPDALEELDRCLEGGAVLMKCLPNCQNINLSDPRFRPFWERMAKAKLPLLAHTGGELSLPVFQPEYAAPRFLRLPLECGVTVIGAHCGTRSLFFDTDYTEEFAKLLTQFPNLFGDNSGMMTPIRCRHLSKLLKTPFQDRMVYGSDMPIPISGLWPRIWGLLSAEDHRRIRTETNLLERDHQLKRAIGFSDASFVRGAHLLRLTETQRRNLEKLS